MQNNHGNITGKTVLVTGGSRGIGFYTALELAQKGADVIIVGQNKERSQKAVKRIKDAGIPGFIRYYVANLASQEEIRKLSEQLHQDLEHLDVLVNNVGGWFTSYHESPDGIEMTFALNHLSYFLLSGLLLDLLFAAPSARVINVSSVAHKGVKKINFDNINFEGKFSPIPVYSHSKLANILFTYELADRLVGHKLTVNALHPGFVDSELYRDYGFLTPIITFLAKTFGKSSPEGAQTSIYLASSSEVEGVSGKYFVNEQPQESSIVSYNKQMAKRLWQRSEEMTGFTYPV
jgi:NAD(P)-dependent dehydrogenase (short-subunit alcohol dehydrogenase family)